MYRQILIHSKNFALKATALVALLIFVASGCNQTDEDITPVVEDLPTLAESLEAFDEEVEYTEFLAGGSENARWGFKRWKRKPTFFTLAAALKYTGLFKTVVQKRLTVFAPDDRAFAELGLNFWNIRYKIDKETLSGILLNHVAGGFVFSTDLDCSLQTLGNSTLRVLVEDGKVAFQDDSDEITNLLFADRRALNSVFHGIDKVLTLSEPDGTIADIAENDYPGEFNELVEALTYTGLASAVSDPEANLTVFAPTDEAFHNLYKVLGIEKITDLDAAIVSKVLLHHVVGARVFSNCLVSGEVPTLNTNINVNVEELTITGSLGSDNTVNLVTDPFLLDIKASNGVIHVIDGVLLPSNVFDPI